MQVVMVYAENGLKLRSAQLEEWSDVLHASCVHVRSSPGIYFRGLYLGLAGLSQNILAEVGPNFDIIYMLSACLTAGKYGLQIDDIVALKEIFYGIYMEKARNPTERIGLPGGSLHLPYHHTCQA